MTLLQRKNYNKQGRDISMGYQYDIARRDINMAAEARNVHKPLIITALGMYTHA